MQIVELVGQSHISSIIQWNPRIKAFRQTFCDARKFGAGHLTKIGNICIDYLLKSDATKHIRSEELVNLDKELACYFGTDAGKRLFNTFIQIFIIHFLSGTFYCGYNKNIAARGCLQDAYRAAKADYIRAGMRDPER